jgi:hypothetical protein|tara:strand:+ start:1217 stop:1408 length:192 start_codon:yes stop_codon:yes gene_type:complete
MYCWHCQEKLIWGGDHQEEDDEGNDLIVTNLSCSKCDAEVLVYLTIKNDMEEDNDLQKSTEEL